MSNTNIDEHSITNNNERYVTADDLTVCDDSDERDDDVEVVVVVEDGDRWSRVVLVNDAADPSSSSAAAYSIWPQTRWLGQWCLSALPSLCGDLFLELASNMISVLSDMIGTGFHLLSRPWK